MKDQSREIIVAELIGLISKGNAHVSFEEAVKGISLDLLTEIPANLPYNIWQLTEHIRIAQWDIVEFCIDQSHKSPDWPDDYWPEAGDKVEEKEWKATLKQISEDRNRFFDLLKDPDNNLYEPFVHGQGQHLLREALLIADHNAYHTGEIIVLRRLLNDWK